MIIWPRVYAAQIAAGDITLEEVPLSFQEYVTTLLEERKAVIWSRANAIVQLPTLGERQTAIWQLPDDFRQAIKIKVAELWLKRGKGNDNT